MRRTVFNLLSLIIFVLGVILVIDSYSNVTGAVIGSQFEPGIGLIFGLVCVAISLVLFVRENFERKIEV